MKNHTCNVPNVPDAVQKVPQLIDTMIHHYPITTPNRIIFCWPQIISFVAVAYLEDLYQVMVHNACIHSYNSGPFGNCWWRWVYHQRRKHRFVRFNVGLQTCERLQPTRRNLWVSFWIHPNKTYRSFLWFSTMNQNSYATSSSMMEPGASVWLGKTF